MIRLISQGGGPSSFYLIKEILRMRGVFRSVHVRHPAIEPGEFTLRELHEVVERLELKVLQF